MPWDAVRRYQRVTYRSVLFFCRPEDDTHVVADRTDPGAVHSLHLSGIFSGNIRVLVRAQLQIDEKAGCILKMAVRSPILEISQIIAECIK